jgi:hypothetical protein
MRLTCHHHEPGITAIKLAHLHNIRLEYHQHEASITAIKLAHQHSTRLEYHQHEAGITARGRYIDTARSWNIITTPPFEGGPFGLYQAYLKSAQTLHEIEAWSTHQQPVHLC